MQQGNKKILLICYSFPPFPGVGGRRWAKFAKYLAEKGYELHVLCSENPFSEKSAWTDDVKDSRIKTYPLPINYPRVFYKGVNGFMDKIIYRLWKTYLSVYSKGVVMERTIFWKKQLINKASDLIQKEGIENVIVSIAPFRLATYAALLKEKFPKINLVVDYRDPWTDNKSFLGFKNLSPKRITHEQQLERNVLKIADKVIAVSEMLTNTIKAKNIQPEKVVTIPNGYDPSDIPIIEKEAAKQNKIRLVYGGSLYNDLDYVVYPLVDALSKLKASDKVLYDKLSFEFYGNINEELKEKLLSPANSCISVHSSVPLNEMQRILNGCDFCLLITPPDYPVVFNTKFCEYLANRKPILLFSYLCEESDFLVKNKLGFHINPNDFESTFNAFIANMDTILNEYNKNFNIDSFSVPYFTTQVEKLLK